MHHVRHMHAYWLSRAAIIPGGAASASIERRTEYWFCIARANSYSILSGGEPWQT